MNLSFFKDQGYSSIILDMGLNIAASANKKILYKKPDGTAGEFQAELDGTNALKYQADNTTWSVAGTWTFQAYCEIDDLKLFGQPVMVEIKQHL